MRACLLVVAVALLVALVGGFVFLGFSGSVPWAAAGGAPTDGVATGSGDARADTVAAGDGTGGEPVGDSEAEVTGDQANPSVSAGSGSELEGTGGEGGGQTGSPAQGEPGSAAGPTAGLSADEINQLIGSSEATKTTTEDFGLGVQDAAVELVGRYRSQGDATLAHAGWLDMFGRCWGCVVVGPGWVDVCLVSGTDEEATGQTLRMEVEEWRRIYAGL